jgi:hypothetical protein
MMWKKRAVVPSHARKRRLDGKATKRVEPARTEANAIDAMATRSIPKHGA